MKESGVWLSLVERCVRDAEAGGSNPLTPTSPFCPIRLHNCSRLDLRVGVLPRSMILIEQLIN